MLQIRNYRLVYVYMTAAFTNESKAQVWKIGWTEKFTFVSLSLRTIVIFFVFLTDPLEK